MADVYYKIDNTTSPSIVYFTNQNKNGYTKRTAGKTLNLTGKKFAVELYNDKFILPEDSSYLFWGLSRNNIIDTTRWDTSEVTSMVGLFKNASITDLDLSSFDTSNVTDMSAMFCECGGLQSVNLSSFDTSKVTSMFRMFESCASLTNVDLSSFNTSNVTNMEEMFYSCQDLEHVDLSSFDTHNVTTFDMFFYHCDNLKEANIKHFDISSVRDMSFMFYFCQSLTKLDLSTFDFSKLTVAPDPQDIFSGCLNLERIIMPENTDWKPLYNYSTNAVFKACTKLPNFVSGATGFEHANNTQPDGYFNAPHVWNKYTVYLKMEV